MLLTGVMIFSLATSIFNFTNPSVFKSVYAKLDEKAFPKNEMKKEFQAANSSTTSVSKRGDRENESYSNANNSYKSTYSIVKPNLRGESFLVYSEKHLYKPGEKIIISGSVSAKLMSRLEYHANSITI